MANWFAPKRYGCGSGLPISWQGWVVTMAYVAMAAGGGLLARPSPIAGLSIILPATILFMIICFKTTAGGLALPLRKQGMTAAALVEP